VLTFVPSPDRFLVEEIPAYPPRGDGGHTFLWIEKRGLTTLDAIARLAARFERPARDVGYAGLKDRQATTRQWLSVPDVDPERAVADGAMPPDLVVLSAARHPHKLRLGHLRGNRFEVVLTGPAGDDEVAALEARLRALAASGVPNRFGAQRFGSGGDNAAQGLALLRGERRERDRRKRRLLLSASQSAVFNHYLALRAAGGPLTAVLAGDVLQKTDSGGVFVSTDPATDQPRVDAGTVVPTGPLPGTREIEPPPGSPARALEDAAIAAAGATREDFARAGRELPGARRPVVLAVTLDGEGFREEPAAEPGARAVRLRFTLPAGGYATVLVAAVTGSAG
jgi:tRNA pseudouridine13 synthase